MVIENVTWKYTNALIKLRGDYGTTWNGTITIKNSTVENAPSSTVSILSTENLEKNSDKDLVFNHSIYNPTKISIDGLKINSSNVSKIQIISAKKADFEKYYLKTFQRKTNKNEETSISKKNITGNGSKNISNYGG